ncbi:MAG: helix-turn-helix domain-containing protein [Chloroflexota bacterium]
MSTDRKSYNQMCTVATALDYVGDRWTLLVVRELLGGAARFNEVRDGLPGIPKNLLTERLRRLEQDGLVRQIKVHNNVLYALTDLGASLRPIVEELGMWGGRVYQVAPARYERSIRAISVALHAILVRAGDALPTERIVIELEVDGEFAEVTLDSTPTVTARPSPAPHARVQTTSEHMAAMLKGKRFDDTTLKLVSGSEDAVKAFIHALG